MYSPKIKENLVVQLYHLKQQRKIPMTKLVNEAVEEYLRRKTDGLYKARDKDSR